jgi:OOP family OmpA-OmpF porin
MRLLFLLNFLFFYSISYCQVKKVSYDYNNGRTQAKGKVRTCSRNDERYTYTLSTSRKTGKWYYYYQNGNIKRIENYKRIKDCYSNEMQDGIWQYYSEQGLLIRQEEYKNGILWTADISTYYLNNKLAGEIRARNGIVDTVRYVETDSINLIKNGDFAFYYGPPQLQISDGQNQIEKQIPFWISPDNNTPDYYNQFRTLKDVPDNLNHEFNTAYNYVGIIVYHKPTDYYTEFITGELNSQLIPNRKYCLKIQIRLSQNAGFFVDMFGAHFSDSISTISNTINSKKEFPFIRFKILDDRNEWSTLCAYFTASGYEKYIVLGRFSSLSETYINKIVPLKQSAGDYNQSAYYLIDRVELLEDTTNCNYFQVRTDKPFIERIDFDRLNSLDSIESRIDQTFVLRNIFFDFDNAELLPTSSKELEKLFLYLKPRQFSVTIAGHTDNIGSDEYNIALSLQRAKAVADWLIKRGIDDNRVHIAGYGAEMPILENNSDENRAINRRVEFKIDSK